MKERLTIETTSTCDVPIDCNKHDYLEIACMHRYELLITLKNGQVINANAVTTQTKPNKIEYFIVESDTTAFEIPMAELAVLDVVTTPSSFKTISFD